MRASHWLVLLCFYMAGVFLTAVPSYAQNLKMLEEEEIKDKEREEKVRQYLEKRKEEEKKILESPLSEEDYMNQNLVEVEPLNVLPSDLVSVSALVPYNVRRKRWGHFFSVTYSQYTPTEYQTDYLAPGSGSFESLFGSAQSPLIEIAYTRKINFTMGSFGVDVAYGYYSNEASDAALGDANLALQMARVGGRYTMDNLGPEPIVAPYGIAGIYMAIYDESQGNSSLNGTTGMALYYGAGAKFQLNWLDRFAAVESYLESGIENTYVFAEYRFYQASEEGSDPDFSNEGDVSLGMTLEF